MQIQNDFLLKNNLWYKIGGVAKYFITCSSKEDISEAFEFIHKNSIEKIFVVGLGTNLVFTDEYFDGAVIQLVNNRHSGEEELRLQNLIGLEKSQSDPGYGQDDEGIKITDDGIVEVFAGLVLDDLIQLSFENNLTGLEWAGGLPGTVGGAVRGNAGAYGGEIKGSLISAEVLDYSGDKPIFKTLTNEQMQFAYRNSFVKQNKKMVVVSAKFGFKKTDDLGLKEAREVYNKNTQNRKDKHPLEYPNTGSVFINPREKEQVEKILVVYPDLREMVETKWYGKVAIASLIDRWGMKGYRIGDAQISKKHALFIVNLGNAKSKDVLQIINDVKKKFFNTFGFELEIEVEIVK